MEENKKPDYDGYTRHWMRQCLEFWQRQYREVCNGGAKSVRRLTYEEACVMTAGADCRVLWQGRPHWMDRPYTEREVLYLFNTEFSESYKGCKDRYGSNPGGPYKIIPNYKPKN